MDADEPTSHEPQLTELARLMRELTEERDWGQFHDPKSLVLALVGEVGEVAELVQWLPSAAAADHFSQPDRRQRIGEELADVLLYLVRLADVLDVDLMDAARKKQAAVRHKYPVDVVRGTAPERS